MAVGVSSTRNGDLIFALAFRFREMATFLGALAFCFREMFTFLAKLRRAVCFYVESGHHGMAMAIAEWRRTVCFRIKSRKKHQKRTFRVGGVAMARGRLAIRLRELAI